MNEENLRREAIFNLQTYLRAQKLRYPDAPSVPIDGIFDSATQNALIDFQLRNSLAPTGIADRTTFELLYEQYLDIIDKSSLPDPIIPFPSYPNDYVVKKGERSFLVATLQYMLNEIGTVYFILEPITVNGIFDEMTERAVLDFQSRTQLNPTGEVNRETWASLARIYNLTLHYIEQY